MVFAHICADCIIDNVLSPAETAALASRVSDQAHAEQEAGYFDQSPDGSRQNISTLMNKGQEFQRLLDHPAVMPLLKHVVGQEMQLSISNAIIVKPGGPQMPLHTDQWWMPQPQRKSRPMRIPVGSVDRGRAHTADWASESDEFIAPPVAAQAIFLASDFVSGNGATMIVPGSHLAGRLPRPEEASDHTLSTAVPLEAAKGCCVVYDARLWHGTGVNTGDWVDRSTGLPWRLGIFSLYCAPWARPQENMVLGALAQALDGMSDEQKTLLGFRAWHAYGRVGMSGFPSHQNKGITEGWEEAGSLIVQGDAIANGGVGRLTRRHSGSG